MHRLTLLASLLLAAAPGCSADPPPPTADAALDGSADPSDTAAATDVGVDAAVAKGPLGLPLTMDGTTWIGVADVDVTPIVAETFEDLNGNAEFDGCLDDPDATGSGCDEPFDDVDGDGLFDAVWIAGFGPKRAAKGVHDPLSVRSMVIARDGEVLVLTGMDFVGLLHFRIDQARAILAEQDGLPAERLVAASSHVHQGPDVFGIWGYVDLDAGAFEPGFDPTYQERVVAAIVASTRAAAAAARPAEVVMGVVDMADRSEWFSGRHFGGTNPKAHQHGLINDIRDPVLAATKVFVMHARDPDDGSGIATLLNFSSHPEVWGGHNQLLSADWVGVARDRIDAALGGLTVFIPESLGGMQSMLGAKIPLVAPDGAWRWQPATDPPEPQWASEGTWEYVHSGGVHVADAALAAVASGSVEALDPFVVRRSPMRVLIDNEGWGLGASLGVADMDPEQVVTDPAECPGYDASDPFAVGCLDTWTWRLRLGPLAVITAPGELLPELFHGFPDDPQWTLEAADPSARGAARDARYFPQHPEACDAVAWADCREVPERDGCDCLRLHAVPYALTDDPATVPPLAALLSPSARYKVAFSAAGSYLSYIVPAPDIHHDVSVLGGPVGDHYEDSVTASSTMAAVLQQAQLALGYDD